MAPPIQTSQNAQDSTIAAMSNVYFFTIVMPWLFALGATSGYLIGPFAIYTVLTMVTILASLQALYAGMETEENIATPDEADEAISDADSDAAISEADSEEFLPLEAMPFVCIKNLPNAITNEAIFQSDFDLCTKVRAMGYSMTTRPKTIAHFAVPRLDTIKEDDREELLDYNTVGLSLIDSNSHGDDNPFQSLVEAVYSATASDPYDSNKDMSPVEIPPFYRPDTPTPPDSDSDDEEFGMFPLERVMRLAEELLDREFEETGHGNPQSIDSKPHEDPRSAEFDEEEGCEDGYETDESSLFIWDPEEESTTPGPVTAPEDSSIAQDLATKTDFPEDWEIVLELRRDGYEVTYAISNTEKQYWRMGNKFIPLIEEEGEDLLAWVAECDPKPLYIHPNFFDKEEKAKSTNTTITESVQPKTDVKPSNDYPDDDSDDSTLFSDGEMGLARPWRPLPHTGILNLRWTKHSSVDANGHIYLVQKARNESQIAMGVRISYKPNSWLTMPTRASAGQQPTRIRLATGEWFEVPELTLTDADGTTEWLADMGFYQEDS